MLRKNALRALIFAAVLLLGYCGHNVYLYRAGVCLDEKRVLSRQEVVKAAVTYWAANKYQFNGKIYKSMKLENSSSAIDEFIKQNPNCCTVSPPDWRIAFLPAALAGNGYLSVTIRYEEEPPRELRTTTRYEKTIEMSPCTTDLHGTFGMEVD